VGPLCVDPNPTPDRTPPRWLLVTTPIWMISLSAWLFVATALLTSSGIARGGSVSSGVRSDLKIVAGLACFAVVVTVIFGAAIGRRREFYWLWFVGGGGTATLLVGYVVAMLATPPTSGSGDNDNAAGAGLVIWTIPTAVVVLTLLWLGAGLGFATTRRLNRRTPDPDRHAQ
jgi:hypothetical protein